MDTPNLDSVVTNDVGHLDRGPRASAHLLELVGRNPGRTHPVFDEVVIGRDLHAEVRVLDSDVSRNHARIRRQQGGEFVLQDLNSRNGTVVNGMPVEARALAFGDKIKVSDQTVYMFIRHDRLEEQLLQAQKLESIGQIASGVAHDFNNLLSALLVNLGYLRGLERYDGAEVQPCLEEMEVALHQAMGLSSQLLAFGRRGGAEGRSVDLSEVLEEVIRLVRRIFDSRIQVFPEIQPGVHVTGERSQLHQVVMNLCINARDAMPDGGKLVIRLCVEALSAPQSALLPPLTPGEYATLTIIDNGHGMEEKTRQRAFEPFFTTKESGKGTGLGLAMVNGIVKAHGGQIHLESDPDGTTFRIFLPRSATAEQPKSAERTTENQPAVTPLALLAEGDAEERARGEELLKSLGVKVLAAADGDEARAILEQRGEELRLIFFDPALPGWKGGPPETTNATSILTTAPNSADTVSDPLGVVPRPFDLERLGQAISHALAKAAPQ
jgi:signal transduction histidine kinase